MKEVLRGGKPSGRGWNLSGGFLSFTSLTGHRNKHSGRLRPWSWSPGLMGLRSSSGVITVILADLSPWFFFIYTLSSAGSWAETEMCGSVRTCWNRPFSWLINFSLPYETQVEIICAQKFTELNQMWPSWVRREQRWCSDVVSRNLVTLLGRRSSLQPHRLCVCAQRLSAASTCDKYGTKRVKLKLETSTSTNNDHHVNCSTLLRKWKKDSYSNVCDRQFITDLCASCVFIKQLHWSQKYTGHKVKKGRKKVNKLDQRTHTIHRKRPPQTL